MKHIRILSVAMVSLAVACGGSSNNTTTTDAGVDAGTGFPQPAGTVAVNFTVDDNANKVFAAGDLQWKGSMLYDTATRKASLDATWTGPWAPLYDDGPFNIGATGGHEPASAVAGDHKWGVTVFITPPATGTANYEYGLVDASAPYNGGWLWVGANGTFSVAAGATAPINAAGITLAKFGTTDVQLIVDKNALTGGPWDTSKVTIKGSGWAWYEVQLLDNGTKGDATAGDGKFTFQLSQYTGTGKPLPHTGLLNTGDKPEFIVVFNGVEYKLGDGTAASAGITAGTKSATATTYTPATIAVNASNKNTYITVP